MGKNKIVYDWFLFHLQVSNTIFEGFYSLSSFCIF